MSHNRCDKERTERAQDVEILESDSVELLNIALARTRQSLRKLHETNEILEREEEQCFEYALAIKENERSIVDRQAKVYQLEKRLEELTGCVTCDAGAGSWL